MNRAHRALRGPGPSPPTGGHGQAVAGIFIFGVYRLSFSPSRSPRRSARTWARACPMHSPCPRVSSMPAPPPNERGPAELWNQMCRQLGPSKLSTMGRLAQGLCGSVSDEQRPKRLQSAGLGPEPRHGRVQRCDTAVESLVLLRSESRVRHLHHLARSQNVNRCGRIL